ncbi:hypothetical protein [Methylomagnum ishizawai]|uniref:hypothetical protein n=1 Tax=Methylomagnum ishizawai TaxID=1760988 RepID=UPI001C330BD4|nr:hypothetical protein [Methylomagnum ishizawai]BBL74189.1 hypothetical protein MishRS11D_12870 [Methylomagnum ishizawai]
MPGIVDMGRGLRGQALQSMGELSAQETQRANTNRALRGQRNQALGQGLGTLAGVGASYALGQLGGGGLTLTGAGGGVTGGLTTGGLGASGAGTGLTGMTAGGNALVLSPQATAAGQAALTPGLANAGGVTAGGTAGTAGGTTASSTGLGTALVNGAYAVGNAAGAAWSWLAALL